MEIQFATRETRTVTDLKPVSSEEFVRILQKYKPREIYNSQWSSKTPLYFITEYSEDSFMMYCNGRADRTPYKNTPQGLFDSLKYQGLSDCFFVVDEDKI